MATSRASCQIQVQMVWADWGWDIRRRDPRRALLTILLEADGKPVTLRELRDLGIPQPTLLVSELEAEGYEIERRRQPSGETAYALRDTPAQRYSVG